MRAAMLVAMLVGGAAAYPASGATEAREQCPGALVASPPSGRDEVPSRADYEVAVRGLDVEAVMFDLVTLLTDSQSCWPADVVKTSAIGESYGGLFIRLAWHCSGSFRNTDGAGGCAGGRLRFAPEAHWGDNVNLDKARSLLLPIKRKYGDALSWGDLYVLAGTTSILHMGGPVTEVCVGRIDEADGTASLPLGPGPQAPACPVPGNCPAPLGAAEIGLIYVNPQGFLGRPDVRVTGPHVREVFSRMGMNDSETVALIGGGHAFGKSHGACPEGAGPGPAEQPLNPWPGLCGTGRGKDTASSGIEGAWTTDPFRWDNEYFQLLVKYQETYKLERGPGGAFQWYTPARPELMMQTTDLALIDDAAFSGIVREFAANQAALDRAFGAVWAKLTTQGGGFADAKRCIQPRAGLFLSPAIRRARALERARLAAKTAREAAAARVQAEVRREELKRQKEEAKRRKKAAVLRKVR